MGTEHQQPTPPGGAEPQPQPDEDVLRVFVTVDVEWWPRSWDNYRSEFRDCFRRYIFGETGRGDYGLPFQLRLANEHGLRFTFFVESLFACEFGLGPLRDIVDLIVDAGQDVQLHAHPEWIRHSPHPIFSTDGRYTFREFTADEQYRLIETARERLCEAGAKDAMAFRAGSFAANSDTLAAVSRNHLKVDSSFELGDGLARAPILEYEPAHSPSIVEYPLATYHDWPGRSRHLQLTACSFSELVFVLEAAKRNRWGAAVLLSHSAELLNRDRSALDRTVLRRFEKLCRWLADRRDAYVTGGLGDVGGPRSATTKWTPIQSPRRLTCLRMGEQAMRWLNV